MADRELDNWEDLYAHFNDQESRRSEALQRAAEEAEALQEFEEWCSGAIERLMQELRAGALSRAREFEAKTGQVLEVQYPSGAPIVGLKDGPEIRFLRIAVGGAQVHVYSSHTRGGLTHIHLLPSRHNSLKHNERLVSEPGAFIVRRSDDGYELRFLRGDSEGAPGLPMTIEVLLFRAFRLLVRWSDDSPN